MARLVTQWLLSPTQLVSEVTAQIHTEALSTSSQFDIFTTSTHASATRCTRHASPCRFQNMQQYPFVWRITFLYGRTSACDTWFCAQLFLELSTLTKKSSVSMRNNDKTCSRCLVQFRTQVRPILLKSIAMDWCLHCASNTRVANLVGSCSEGET